MSKRAVRAAVLLAIVGLAACSSEDPSLERRGPDQPRPVMDPAGGHPSQGASGDAAAVGDAGEPAGGGGAGQGGAAGSGSSERVLFCDALAVVRDKCQRCHGEPLLYGAPVAFLTYDDFQAFYFEETKTRWWQRAQEMVSVGFMPYVQLNDPPTSLMPPVEPLTEAEKVALLTWFEQGAEPAGGTECP